MGAFLDDLGGGRWWTVAAFVLDDSGAVAVLCQLLLRGFAVKDSGRGRGGRW